MKVRGGLCIGLSILICACAEIPEKVASDYQLASMHYLQEQKNWFLTGRLAVVSERESISASISWSHDEIGDEIELAGPLAQGKMKISVKEHEVVVDDGDHVSVYQGRVDDIVAALLGVEMPVTALRFWVLGVNDPVLAFVEQSGGFYQAGWSVRYGELQKVNAKNLPKKMLAEKDKARIKLIVDGWGLM